jgi:hypothetical protein
VEGRVVLEPPVVLAQQELRRPRGGDLFVHALAVARLEVAGEEGRFPVHHHRGAHLEDVGRLPDQACVLHHLRAPPSRLDHHLDARAVARLESARREQREVTLRGAEERRALSEQRAVEIGVDASDRH